VDEVINPKIILAATAMVALAGCAGGRLGKAEKVAAQGTDFDKSLSTGYLRLGRTEQAEADYAMPEEEDQANPLTYWLLQER
jgi:hypothetical protein|tara:strand:+ start:282 stop:527 length:246 start_codon:yes stop_codon:yes gene_type:complete